MPPRPGIISPVQYTKPDPPRVHLASEFPRSVVASRVRSGAWLALRRGAFVDARDMHDASGFERVRKLTLARVSALHQQLTTPFTVSHHTAAVLHGLPVLVQSDSVHLIQSVRRTDHGGKDAVRHFGTVPIEHRTTVGGVSVTNLERTVVDVARSFGLRDGLVIADAALHIGADQRLIDEILNSFAGSRGVARARVTLSYADGGAESPGETDMRLALLLGGLPVPVTQYRIDTPEGTFWSDLGLPELGLVCEYDGLAKYTAGGSAPDAVLREKRREDLIRAEGFAVLRADAREVRHPPRLIARARKLVALGPLAPRADLLSWSRALP